MQNYNTYFAYLIETVNNSRKDPVFKEVPLFTRVFLAFTASSWR